MIAHRGFDRQARQERADDIRPARTKLEFFGKSLFIPSFFVVTGFLIDPVAFVQSVVDNFPLVAGIIATLLLGKGIAAAVVGRAFGYTPAAGLTIWAPTLPQVAATLAATLVAYHTVNAAGERMLDTKMLNAVLVLMVATSILGPVLTERFAPGMISDEARRNVVRVDRRQGAPAGFREVSQDLPYLSPDGCQVVPSERKRGVTWLANEFREGCCGWSA